MKKNFIKIYKVINLVSLLLFIAISYCYADEFSEAEKQYYNRSYNEALTNYQKALEKYKNNLKLSDYIQYQIAECYSKQGKNKEAITEYQKVIAKSQDKALTHDSQWKISEIHYHNKEYSKAGDEFMRYADNNPDSKQGLIGYAKAAICYDKAGSKLKALNAYKKCKKDIADKRISIDKNKLRKKK